MVAEVVAIEFNLLYATVKLFAVAADVAEVLVGAVPVDKSIRGVEEIPEICVDSLLYVFVRAFIVGAKTMDVLVGAVPEAKSIN